MESHRDVPAGPHRGPIAWPDGLDAIQGAAVAFVLATGLAAVVAATQKKQ